MLIPFLVFTYPIALTLIYLFIYRYKVRELGINLRFWYLPFLIHLLWGGMAMITARKTIIWHDFIVQNGIVGTLLAGLICAALAEEFTRMLLQTRLGVLFRNKGTGFVTATILWACLHIPKSYPHTTDGAVQFLFFIIGHSHSPRPSVGIHDSPHQESAASRLCPRLQFLG